ncbi:hypothetical protein M885DRAFT_342815 [Pelagophyceae sp. CCMP2097]|nr:hypothetical protein M885DRAFT_342815 [Pelagophyceae sp. CCMP2097]
MCPFAPSTRATAPAGTCFGCGQNMTDVAAAHGTANSSSDRSETTTPVSASARTTRLPPQSATSARGRDKAPCRAEYEDDDSATDVAVEPQGSRMVRRTAWTSSAASSPAPPAAPAARGAPSAGDAATRARSTISTPSPRATPSQSPRADHATPKHLKTATSSASKPSFAYDSCPFAMPLTTAPWPPSLQRFATVIAGRGGARRRHERAVARRQGPVSGDAGEGCPVRPPLAKAAQAHELQRLAYAFAPSAGLHHIGDGPLYASRTST